jgi:hypothetical protein
MESYVKNLFEKDEIGFKTIDTIKESTKTLVLRLNDIIKKRDGRNITKPEILQLVNEINELGDKIKLKMDKILLEINESEDKDIKMITHNIDSKENPDKSSNDSIKKTNTQTDSIKEQIGGFIESISLETSTIDLLNSINNAPCSSSITQCADRVSTCGQSGGGIDPLNKLFINTLNKTKKFNITKKNIGILYNLVKLHSSK